MFISQVEYRRHLAKIWQIGVCLVGSAGFWLGSGYADIGLQAATDPVLPDSDVLLQQYDQALKALPPLPNLQYRQQVKVTGAQAFTATLDVLLRQDGSWQAWLAQGDRIRLLDSKGLEIVNQSDVFKLYSVYVSEPDALMPEVGFNLLTQPHDYTVISTESKQLRSRLFPDRTHEAIHLVLEPTAEGQGQLRELWLDPETALPYQALLFLTGVWGESYILLNFEPVEEHWLPTAVAVNLGYGFWTLEGLSRRVFRGTLEVRQDYQDYQILPDGEALRFLPSQPPVDTPPTVAGLPNSSRIESGDVQLLGTDENGNRQFSIGLRNQDSDSVLTEEITAFNLTRPASRDALTQIDILATMGLGSQPLPVYLFQFDTERPLSPIQPASTRTQNHPEDVFADPPRAIKILGN